MMISSFGQRFFFTTPGSVTNHRLRFAASGLRMLRFKLLNQKFFFLILAAFLGAHDCYADVSFYDTGEEAEAACLKTVTPIACNPATGAYVANCYNSDKDWAESNYSGYAPGLVYGAGQRNYFPWNSSPNINNCVVGDVYHDQYVWPKPASCPLGTTFIGPNVGDCTPLGTKLIPQKNLGQSCNNKYNPCNAATGNKYQVETDIPSTGAIPGLIRHYNSLLPYKDFNIGVGWTWYANSRFEQITSSSLSARRPSGQRVDFRLVNGVWQTYADISMGLIPNGSGYILTLRDGGRENYDSNGALVSITTPQGQTTTIAPGVISGTTNIIGPFGHTLTYAKGTNNDIATITAPDNQVIRYGYDNNRNLTQVTYPDNTAKIYYYENSGFLNYLTGIAYATVNPDNSLSNLQRFSTYGYYNSSNAAEPSNGKATLTQHAQTDNGSAQERFTLAYDVPAANQTTVTDPVGAYEVMSFQTNLGVKNLTSKQLYNASGVAVDAALQQAFDLNNNLVCRKDEVGHVTTYQYNPTNQRTGMTEGLAGDCSNPPNSTTTTSVTRTTFYQYLSPTLDLPTVINSPSVAGLSYAKVTTIDYGNTNAGDTDCYNQPQYLPCRITQAGYTPTGGAVSRRVVLHYNNGQVTYINGPRSPSDPGMNGLDDVTTLEHYACNTGRECGQLKKITNALGHITTYDLYDANGRLTQMTDPNGLRTSYTYDPRGRVKTVTQTPTSGASAVTQYSYTPWGDVSQVIDPDGVVLNYQYDAAHYLRFIVDAAGNYIHYNYDLKGNRTQDYTYDPTGNLSRSVGYAYDLRNYLSQVNLAGNVTQIVYDAVGNLRSETDPNTHTTTHTPDALNRLISSLDALNGTTVFGYDVNDRPTTVTAPNNLSTQYLYDDLGNLLKEVSPDRRETNYTYDAVGNVLTVTDARQITTTYAYDALNRVTSKTSSDSTTPNYTYIYDRCSFKGKLCNVSRNGAGHLIFGYDGLGRQTYHLDLTSGFLYNNYVFTRAGRLKHIDYPNGVAVDYTYNNLGRVNKVSATINATTTTLANSLQYYPFGPLSGLSFGNGKPYGVFYDTAYRQGARFDGVYFESITGYDGNGNIAQRYAPTWQSFGYDPLNRLTQASDSTNYGNLGYGYDGNGNRSSETRNGTTTPYYYYENTNQLYHAGDSDWRLLDAAGNTTWSNGLWAVGYDGYGRLLSASKAQSSYDYNAFDRRTRKTAGGVTSYFAYGPQGELLYETDGTNTKAYVYLNGIPLGRVDNNTSVYYYHTDHLGTPQVMTDGAGTVVWRAGYEPFGKATVTVSTVTNNLGAAGMYRDSETGLYYWGARYYDPRTGRGTSPDRMGVAWHVRRYQANLGVPNQPPLEINPYVAVANNPLRWIDPTGLTTITYNASTGTITVMSAGGAEGTYSAANNAASTSNGPFPPGTFPYSYYSPHTGGDANSAFGSNGNFIFDVPGRTGMGVHSGRTNSCDKAGRCGVEHATEGCIRTTDEATEAIKQLQKSGDPVTSITVIR